MFDEFKKMISYMNYRYELATHIYMLEPWEKKFISKNLIKPKVP